jgi:putative ABC transport system substrate-binding protein
MVRGIRRRSVVLGLAGAALLPGSGWAQGAGALKRIGILIRQGSKAQGQWRVDAFDAGLRRHGLINGQTAQIEYRWGEGNPEAIKKAAEELVAARMDVLIGTNTPATFALRAATASIPIIFVNVTDPRWHWQRWPVARCS